VIQQGYGPQNTSDTVFFTERDEAVILVKASDGTSPLMANLSNLATLRANGTIPSDDELKSEWLRLDGPRSAGEVTFGERSRSHSLTQPFSDSASAYAAFTNVLSSSAFRMYRMSVIAFISANSEAPPMSSRLTGNVHFVPLTVTV